MEKGVCMARQQNKTFTMGYVQTGQGTLEWAWSIDRQTDRQADRQRDKLTNVQNTNKTIF